MDIIVDVNKSNGKAVEVSGNGSYKESIKKMLYTALGNSLDEETQKAIREMTNERETAIKLIAEEQKLAIKKIVEDEKKAIWAKTLEAQQSEVFGPETIKEYIAQAYVQDKSDIGNVVMNTSPLDTDGIDAAWEEKVELEILPPRDQNEIDTINTYLNSLPEVMTTELTTLVDKSVFKVVLREPMNFIEKLGSIPQVLNAEEVIEKGQKKIKITLSAKSRLERNQNEMNAKVNKIFVKKK
jgi:hypothetical protein